MLRRCETCGKEFNVFPSRVASGAGRFCSVACKNAWTSVKQRGDGNQSWRGGKTGRVCQHCGKSFDTYPSRTARFCSRACAAASQRGERREHPSRVIRKCQNCGKQFETTQRRQGAFCSGSCMGEYRRKTKKYRGQENPNWRGGVTPENRAARTSIKYQEWREKVFERDNWTCRECGARREVGSVVLHAHHVREFATHHEMRLDVANGITLCERCHMTLHGLNCWARERKFGEKNPNHKLTWERVGEIRARYVEGARQKALAQEFGVTQAHVSAIVLGKSWNRGPLDEPTWA